MTLWLAFAAMILLTLAGLLLPLLRRPSAAGHETADYDIEVYRSQLAELDQSSGQGQLSAAEAESARAEIGRASCRERV